MADPEFVSAEFAGDCSEVCSALGCNQALIGDNTCHRLCSVLECGYDLGDCGQCASGCFLDNLLDSECQPECDTEYCFFDASACRECAAGCTNELLLNSECDAVCNFSPCDFDFGNCPEDVQVCSEGCLSEYLGNDFCNLECNTAECNYDDFDCLCAEGCTFDMLGNDVCDASCYVFECGYDDGDCDGLCAPGCEPEMVGDGLCQDECWNSDCDWDRLDCGCASDCRFEELETCKDACLVASCEYAEGSCTDLVLIEFAKNMQALSKDLVSAVSFDECYTTSSALFNGTPCTRDTFDRQECAAECNIAECGYSWGACSISCDENCTQCTEEGQCLLCESGMVRFFTECLAQCPYGFEDDSNGFCILQADTSTKESPQEYFVIHDDDASDYGLGTEVSPFTRLSVALVSIYTRYSVLTLLESEYVLSEIPSDYVLGSTATSLNTPLDRATTAMKELHIRPQSGTATFKINSGDLMVFHASSFLNISSVDFTVDSLSAHCTGLYCNYCPTLTFEDDAVYDEYGAEVTDYFDQCRNLFSSYSLFIVTGTLELHQVRFDDVRNDFASIIFSMCGTLVLDMVDFNKIKVSETTSSAVIVAECTTAALRESGSITFSGGSVKLLNDGYLINFESGNKNGFIYATMLNKLAIDSVAFSYNIATGDGISAMVQVELVYQTWITNCVINNNIFEGGAFVIGTDENDIGEFTLVNNSTVSETSDTHLLVQNVTFTQNVFDDCGAIFWTGDEFLGNIHLHDLEFTSNSLETTLVAIVFGGDCVACAGNVYSKTSQHGEYVQAYFPERKVMIENVNFTDNIVGAFGVLRISGVPILELDTITIERAKTGEFSLNEAVVSTFIELEESYIYESVDQTPEATLTYLVYIQDSTSITMTNWEVSKSTLSLDQGVLEIDTCDILIIEHFSAITLQLDAVALLTLRSIDEAYANEMNFDNVSNMGYFGTGGVYASSCRSLVFTNSNFTSMFGQSGTVYSQDTAVSFDNCLFYSNSAAKGTATGLFFSVGVAQAVSELTITRSIFRGGLRTAEASAVTLYTAHFEPNPVLLTIHNCTFEFLLTSTTGAAIGISESISILTGSSISDCVFQNNTAWSGILAIKGEETGLLIENCLFTGNEASLAGVIHHSAGSNFTLTIRNSTFTFNTGGAVIFPNEHSDKCIIQTEYCTFSHNAAAVVLMYYVAWNDIGSTLSDNVSTEHSTITAAVSSRVTLVGTQILRNIGNRGTAAYVSLESEFECTSCVISDNYAFTIAGGILVESSVFKIKDSVLSNNVAESVAAALSVYRAPSADNLIQNTQIYSNQASEDYSIMVSISNLVMDQCHLFGNTGQRSGGITLVASSLTITDSTFEDQHGGSGALLSSSDSTISLSNSIVRDMTTTESCGAIRLAKSAFSMHNTTVSSLEAPSSPFLCAVLESSVDISDSVLTHLYSEQMSILRLLRSSALITNTVFDSNKGANLLAELSSTISIVNSTFSNSESAMESAGISVWYEAKVSVQSSTFVNLTTEGVGGAIELFQLPYVVTVTDSVFQNCSSYGGGALHAKDSFVSISQSVFMQNHAISSDSTSVLEKFGRGGAISLECDHSQCKHNLTSNKFSFNVAGVSGGAISWLYTEPFFEGNEFNNNTAAYGDDIASEPQALILYSSNVFRRLEEAVLSLSSGEEVSSNLSVAIVDKYNQAIATDSSSLATLTCASGQITGTSSVKASAGVYDFSHFSVISDPGTSFSIQVSSSAITNFTLDIPVTLRECYGGEIIVEQTCVACHEGTYSLDPYKGECLACLESASCLGAEKMVPKPGYWRVSNTTDTFFECPIVEACLGGEMENGQLSYTGECKSGYYGNLCHSCELGYTKYTVHQCFKCNESVQRLFYVVVIVAFNLIFYGVLVKRTLHSALVPKALASVRVKLLVNFLRLSLILSMTTLKWPALVEGLFQAFRVANTGSQILAAVDCTNGEEDAYYYRLLGTSIYPFVVTLGIVLFYGLLALWKRQLSIVKEYLPCSLVVAYVLVIPGVAFRMLEHVSCVEVGADEYWVSTSTSVKCWTETHILYAALVAVPCFLLWGVFVPALGFALMVRHKKQLLFETPARRTFTFLCHGYTRSCYYWEFVNYLRLMALIACVVLLRPISFGSQALLSVVVLILFFYLQCKFAPFNDRRLNTIETRGLAILSVTAYYGLCFVSLDLPDYLSIGFALTMIAGFVYYVIIWLACAFEGTAKGLLTKAPRLRRWLFKGIVDGHDDALFDVREQVAYVQQLGTEKQYTLCSGPTSPTNHRVNARATMIDLFLDRVHRQRDN